jgi:hypothetical protein
MCSFLGNHGEITVYSSPAIAGPKFLAFLSLFGPKNLDVTVTYVPSVGAVTVFVGTHKKYAQKGKRKERKEESLDFTPAVQTAVLVVGCVWQMFGSKSQTNNDLFGSHCVPDSRRQTSVVIRLPVARSVHIWLHPSMGGRHGRYCSI